jgi:alkaline phosphatase D
MTLTRRRFLGRAVPLGALPFLPACAGSAPAPTGDEAEARSAKGSGDVFAHGVASGDPLVDAVMLWTRVTPPEAAARAPVSVD